MQMITFLAAAAFYASAEAAKLTNTPQDFASVKAGQPFTITWVDAAGPVTILLKNGLSTNLNTVSTIASGQTGNSFSWTPSASLPEDTYAIEITDSDAPNYSVQFPITGGAPTQSSAAPTSAAPSYTDAPSYSSSEPAGSYPASTIASTGYSSASRNATSSGYYTATSASMRPTSSANATSIVSSSTLLTSTHSTAKPSPTNLPNTSIAVAQSSPFALLLLSLASVMFFL